MLTYAFMAMESISAVVFPLLVICGVSLLVAVPVSVLLNRMSMRGRVVALVTGLVLTGFGLSWWSQHGDEPEIFSPILIGFLGAPILVGGAAGVGLQETNPRVFGPRRRVDDPSATDR